MTCSRDRGKENATSVKMGNNEDTDGEETTSLNPGSVLSVQSFSKVLLISEAVEQQLQSSDDRLHLAALPLPKAPDGPHPTSHVPERVYLWTWTPETWGHFHFQQWETMLLILWCTWLILVKYNIKNMSCTQEGYKNINVWLDYTDVCNFKDFRGFYFIWGYIWTISNFINLNAWLIYTGLSEIHKVLLCFMIKEILILKRNPKLLIHLGRA